MKNIKGIRGIIKIAPFVLTACPIGLIFANLLDMLHGVSWGFTTITTQWFFDSVEKGVQGIVTYKQVIGMALVMGGAVLLSQILNGVANISGDVITIKIMRILKKKSIEKQ